MNLSISVPSKSFFVGEYLALHGGPVLTINTHPRFELSVESGKFQNPFHEESPAGKLISQNYGSLRDLSLVFKDPHHGRGGFGASSAQFAMVYALKNIQAHFSLDSERFYNWKVLLKDYQDLATNSAVRPSGADLIGQVCGKMTYFHKNQGKIKTFSWPFSEIGFCILRTGFKLATHEHLKSLVEFNSAEFAKAALQVIDGLAKIDSQEVVAGVQNYHRELIKQKKVAHETLVLLRNFENLEGVLAMKGCGALGADAVMLVFETCSDFLNQIRSLNLEVLATHKDLSEGMLIQDLKKEKIFFERTT